MSSPRNEAVQLLNASTETEVHHHIQKHFYDEENWRPLGKEKNNFGVVENQAASPTAGLAEIIVNSIDAILLKNYRQKYGNEDSEEFNSMQEAAANLLSNGDEDLVMAADGKKGGPISLTIEDTGEGKPHDEFEDTFLGLLSPGKLKQDYNFLQGQYGMGSTAVLPFCGEKGYKLIISASHEKKGDWSWSLIRKNEEKTRYEYFTIDGSIPNFSGSVRGQEYGTFVKLYDYQVNQKSNLASDRNLRRYLERYLLDLPIPLTLDERREYESYMTSDTTTGMLDHITKRHSDLIESKHTVTYSFENENLGTRDIQVILFKQDSVLSDTDINNKNLFVSGRKHRDQAIFFSVNGQTHGDQGLSFIKNRCGYPRTAEDCLVFVDFSDISGADLVNLFKPARDRITDKPIARDLISGLEDAIKKDERLSNAEELRREKVIKNKDEDVTGYFDNLISDNPVLKEFFQDDPENKRHDEEIDSGPEPVDLATIKRDPPHIPDKINPIEAFRSYTDYDQWDSAQGILQKEVPTDSTRILRFHLNAPDNYFSRERSEGDLSVTPSESIKSWQFTAGILTLRMQPLPGTRAGTELPVTVEVSRPTSESLSSTVRLQFVEPEKSEDDSEDPDKDRFQYPEVITVKKESWDEHEFGEDDVVRIDDYSDDTGEIAIFVNVDCIQLQNYISRKSISGADQTELITVFKQSVADYSLSQYVKFIGAKEKRKNFPKTKKKNILKYSTQKQIYQKLLQGL